MSRQKFTVGHALQILQNLLLDCFDKDESDSESEALVNAEVASVMVGEFESSESNNEEVDSQSQPAHHVVQGATGLLPEMD